MIKIFKNVKIKKQWQKWLSLNPVKLKKVENTEYKKNKRITWSVLHVVSQIYLYLSFIRCKSEFSSSFCNWQNSTLYYMILFNISMRYCLIIR